MDFAEGNNMIINLSIKIIPKKEKINSKQTFSTLNKDNILDNKENNNQININENDKKNNKDIINKEENKENNNQININGNDKNNNKDIISKEENKEIKSKKINQNDKNNNKDIINNEENKEIKSKKINQNDKINEEKEKCTKNISFKEFENELAKLKNEEMNKYKKFEDEINSKKIELLKEIDNLKNTIQEIKNNIKEIKKQHIEKEEKEKEKEEKEKEKEEKEKEKKEEKIINVVKLLIEENTNKIKEQIKDDVKKSVNEYVNKRFLDFFKIIISINHIINNKKEKKNNKNYIYEEKNNENFNDYDKNKKNNNIGITSDINNNIKNHSSQSINNSNMEERKDKENKLEKPFNSEILPPKVNDSILNAKNENKKPEKILNNSKELSKVKYLEENEKHNLIKLFKDNFNFNEKIKDTSDLFIGEKLQINKDDFYKTAFDIIFDN